MTVRQHSFYLDDDDWVALRHHCLDRGMSVSSFIAQAARDAVGAREIKEVRLMEVSVTATPPHPSQTVTRTNEIEDGQYIRTGTGAPATIPVNPVRAVPKPVSKAKAARR